MTKRCHPCSMLYCVSCSRLRTEHGHKMSPHHCQKHCRHKKKREILSVVRVLDRRSQAGMAIK